jgi:Asp-tRNA(Asn)/Glu-tRNA(Gln) amidotransferase A subunit family amidase
LLLKFLGWLQSGEKSPRDLLEICLRRIAGDDGELRAWVEVAPQPPLDSGPLNGIPFGAKDIFETRGMATEYGSALYAGRKGERDAAVIAELRSCGAVLLGKTHTTAFASFDPTPTGNPRLRGHTPGGSSSGSAAAVAAGMVPFALGTQTLGSVLRPASYCGVCGFKPSFGLLPVDGVLAFAPSLDTVGLFTETAADMAELWTRGFGGEVQAEFRRAAYLPLPADEPMARAAQDAVERLRAGGIAVDILEVPAGWERLVSAARTINSYEGARTHRERLDQFGERMGVRLAELLRHGREISDQEYEDARAQVQRMKSTLHGMFWEWAVLLSPAATGVAPSGLRSTGDPSNNAPWTAVGVPAISVPMPAKYPAGLQIAAAWGRDDALLAVACEVSGLLRGLDLRQ